MSIETQVDSAESGSCLGSCEPKSVVANRRFLLLLAEQTETRFVILANLIDRQLDCDCECDELIVTVQI